MFRIVEIAKPVFDKAYGGFVTLVTMTVSCVDCVADIPVNDSTCPLTTGFSICRLPGVMTTLVTDNPNPLGKMILMVSLVTIVVESLKVILAWPCVLTTVLAIANPADVSVPAVVPVILTLVQLSILPPELLLVDMVQLP